LKGGGKVAIQNNILSALFILTSNIVSEPNGTEIRAAEAGNFEKQLKAFLLQQTFYSVDEYLSYV
jgi:hypothetical protein